MSRFFTWCLIAIVVIVAIVAGVRFSQSSRNQFPVQIVTPTNTSLIETEAPSQEETALLMVEKGKVEITRAIEKMTIIDEYEVMVGDQITTMADSTAMLIFPDNDVLRLATNTEVTLVALTSSASETKVMLEQSKGSSWSHVEPLLDRKHQYQVETPTLVATVRGTVFNVSVETPQESWVGVNESQVAVMRKADQSWVQVTPGQFVSARDKSDTPLSMEKMDSKKLSNAWFVENITKDQMMEKMMNTQMGIPMKRYFLRDNRNQFFSKVVQPTLSPSSFTNTLTPKPPIESVQFDPVVALRYVLKELTANNRMSTDEATIILQDTNVRDKIHQMKTEAEIMSFILNYIQQLRSIHLQPSAEGTPTTPAPTNQTTSASPTTKPTPSATASPTPLDNQSPTATATTTAAPSPSPSASTVRPSIFFTPNNNFRTFSAPTNSSPSPTSEQIR